MSQITWLIIGLLCLIIEWLTVTFFAIFLALAAFVMCFVSIFVYDIAIQLLIYTVIFLIFLPFAVILKKKLAPKEEIKTNIDTLIGMEAIVKKEIKDEFSIGLVNCKSTSWSAIADEKIEEGTIVVVEKIEGVKLRVRRK